MILMKPRTVTERVLFFTRNDLKMHWFFIEFMQCIVETRASIKIFISTIQLK